MIQRSKPVTTEQPDSLEIGNGDTKTKAEGDDTEKSVTTEQPDSLEVGNGDTNTKAEDDIKNSVTEKQQESPEVTTTAISDSPSNTNNQASDADIEGTLLKVLLPVTCIWVHSKPRWHLYK